MKSAALPKPDGPKVKYDSDGPRATAASSGTDNVPGEVLKALVRKTTSCDRLGESTIVQRPTVDCGRR